MYNGFVSFFVIVEGVCFRMMKKFLTYLSLVLAFGGFSANLSNVYALKQQRPVANKFGVKKKGRKSNSRNRTKNDNLKKLHVADELCVACGYEEDPDYNAPNLCGVSLYGNEDERRDLLDIAERAFYRRYGNKSSESPMSLNILFDNEKRQGVKILFSPTYFIENFGFEKHDPFLKYSVEIVDKDTNLAIRKKRGNIFDYAKFFKARHKNPDLEELIPIRVFPGGAGWDCFCIDFYIDKKFGVNKNYEKNVSVDKGFEFKPGKSYVVNFYADSEFDQKNLKFSCETVAFRQISEAGQYTSFAHPKKFNRDYYASLLDKCVY